MSKNNSRTKNTIYNFISSIGGQFLTIIMQFVVRTVFIKTLGSQYLGINGLFSNILTMLSLAELGVGSAILFKLYEPIAKNDEKRITILINFYKRIYFIIGLFICVVGLLLIPLLPLLINDYSKISALGINIVLIYIFYLLKSVSSYLFFAYKSAIIKANQKGYLLNLLSYIFTIITGVIQIISLLLFKNFELYIIVSILEVIIQNYVGAIMANKLYPYIKNRPKERLEKKEVIEIMKDCSALLIFKINNVVLKATDNVVISVYLGLSAVGIYSNYYILYTTINGVFTKIFDSVKHSLGNLHATKEKTVEYIVFKSTNLIAAVLGATAGIGIFCVSNEFVRAWIGKEWVIAQPFALLMGIELFTLSTRSYLTKYRDAMGLFRQAKYRPLFGMIINLIVSIVLVKYWGICGVLVGTIAADWLTVVWFDPYIIHKYGFENEFPVKKHYLRNLKYVAVTIVAGSICYLICNNFILGLKWISVLIHSCICAIIVPSLFIITSINTEEEKFILDKIKKVLSKFKKNKKVTV